MSDPAQTVTPETKTCEHENFSAVVDVHRITQVEGGPVGEFVADVRIICVDCKLPFRFRGVPMGFHYDHPTTGVDRLTLAAPIEPDTAEAIARLEGARGFSVNLVKGGERVS